MRRPPPPPVEPDEESPPTASEIVGSLAGVALLGLGAFELHRRGKLGEALAALFGVAPASGMPSPSPSPAPRAKKRVAASTTPKRKRGRGLPKSPPPPLTPEEQDAAAAQLLGVRVDASADEVRRAFRRRVNERLAAGVGFGDLASDEKERQETVAITAAKNRLVERARRQSPSP